MNDEERSALTDLAVSYRYLFAAIIHRAVLDYGMKKYRAEVEGYFNSGAADLLLLTLDLNPDEFKRRLFSGLIKLTVYEYAGRRPSNPPFDDTED